MTKNATFSIQQPSFGGPDAVNKAGTRVVKRTHVLARRVLLILAAMFLLPFVYLTSLSLVHSGYVHYQFPSRGFLKAYAVPSNTMVRIPGIGRIYSDYFKMCAGWTGADYNPPHESPNRIIKQ